MIFPEILQRLKIDLQTVEQAVNWAEIDAYIATNSPENYPLSAKYYFDGRPIGILACMHNSGEGRYLADVRGLSASSIALLQFSRRKGDFGVSDHHIDIEIGPESYLRIKLKTHHYGIDSDRIDLYISKIESVTTISKIRVTDEPTKLQMAAVMLLKGTPEQQTEAFNYVVKGEDEPKPSERKTLTKAKIKVAQGKVVSVEGYLGKTHIELILDFSDGE